MRARPNRCSSPEWSMKRHHAQRNDVPQFAPDIPSIGVVPRADPEDLHADGGGLRWNGCGSSRFPGSGGLR